VRYVILEHDHPVLHWDFLLEAGEVLRAWRLAEPPWVGVTVAATANFDHRLFYLDYEGPVSGNRGTVTRWDGGTYLQARETEDKRLVLQLAGQRLRGTVILEHLGDQEWSLHVRQE
jgi:hypothetical protein